MTREFGKFRDMWILNYTFLNNQWVNEEITKEIRKYFKMSENGSKTYQKLWNISKQCLEGNL